jgi:nicotinate-nucleotide adenylyltransferase
MLSTQGLDQVWLVVTPLNPFKQGREISPDADRLAMVRLAIRGHQGLVASGFELDLPKPSYTADSLRFMRQRWPDHTFDLIIGSDNLAVFHLWRDPQDILDHHRLLVYPRAGYQKHLSASAFHGHPGIRFVADAPLVDVSSTAIRKEISEWKSVEGLVDQAVLDLIHRKGLYRS